MNQNIENILLSLIKEDKNASCALLKFSFNRFNLIEIVKGTSDELQQLLDDILTKQISAENSKTLNEKLGQYLSDNYPNNKFLHFVKDIKEKVFLVFIFYMTDERLISKKIDSCFGNIIQEIEKNDICLLNKTINNIDVSIYTMNSSTTKFLYLSKSIEQILGYSNEEILSSGTALFRNIHKEYFPFVKNFLEKAKKGEKIAVEYKVDDKNGNGKYIRQTAYPIYEGGKLVQISGLIADLSEEKNEIIKLIDSEEKFRVLVETASDLIFTLNDKGEFVIVNKNGATSLNYTPNEMVNRHFLDFVHEKSREEITSSFSKLLNTGTIIKFEVELIGKSDKNVLFEIVVRSIFNNDVLTEVIGIGRDITKRRTNEIELQDLNSKLIEANRIISIERDRAKQQITVLEELGNLKNQFISNVSHELRTPLASIIGFAETIVSDSELTKKSILDFNNIILTEGKRLAELINDVLDFSRLESNKKELDKSSFDIIAVTREVIENYRAYAEEKEISINIQIPEAKIVISADKDRISKCIKNLLSNAIKFTNSNGRVTVIVQDFLREVEIVISDTGIGIPKEEISKLFKKFSKVDHPGRELPGAGFGLVTVKQIIDLHNGMIRVNSELNKGTTFIIRLPKNT